MSRPINRLEAMMVIANDKVRISTMFFEPAKLGAQITFEESAYIDETGARAPLSRGIQTKVSIDVTPDQFERVAEDLMMFADQLRRRAAGMKAHADLEARLNSGEEMSADA